MGVRRWLVGVGAAVSLATVGAVGCGDSSAGSGGSGANGTSSGTMSTGSGTTGSGSPCAPGASCTAVDKSCIGIVDNAGQTQFGLRMSEIDFTSPTAFTKGIIKASFGGSAIANDAACNLYGSGYFSWLLQFDKTASTLKTGGAKPVAEPSLGYSFDDEMISQSGSTFHVQPVTYQGVQPDGGGSFAVSSGQDAVIPIFLDQSATPVVVLPLHELRITMGTLSSNNNCIGRYNAATLDPANNCVPDGMTPAFVTGGKLDGYVTLEEADTVVVAPLKQTLCVLLSGNPGMYGKQAPSGTTVCKRSGGGKILYEGGWCSTTNSAGGCADAETVAADFAASSVKVNN